MIAHRASPPDILVPRHLDAEASDGEPCDLLGIGRISGEQKAVKKLMKKL